IEHYGVGEPYLPVLAALGQLGRGPHGAWLVATLAQHAPSWLVQMPGLLTSPTLEAVQHRSLGTTPASMLRQLVDAVEVLTSERTLVLVLEDLHWSDRATVACLAYLAQRREPARLLVLGTYRLVETVLQAHPLRGLVQELCGRGQAGELC